MRYFLLVFILVAASIVGIGCEQTESPQKPRTGAENRPSPGPATDDEPPLLLDDEPLLLLDDGPEREQSDGPQADNSRCFVCHINYVQEDIALVHARADIGCAGCHGESDEHMADESWASGGNGTPPDIMYPRLKINPFCMGCHLQSKIDTEQHRPLFAGTAKEKYCTDCHGDHRLADRKCKWK